MSARSIGSQQMRQSMSSCSHEPLSKSGRERTPSYSCEGRAAEAAAASAASASAEAEEDPAAGVAELPDA